MKVKLLSVFFLLNTLFIFSQTELDKNTSKRIRIENPTQSKITQLLNAGIDLRCGAIFSENSLRLELTNSEWRNLDKAGISYSVEVEDLAKFYSERAKKSLPIAKANLEAIKVNNKLKRKQKIAAKSLSSISNVIIDNPLQYYGENEVDWTEPTNFNLGASFGGCLTVQETLDELDQMRTLYPSLISVKADASPSNQTTWGNTLGSVGNQWTGQTIYYVKISDNPDGADDATEPDILYTSMIHSRELSALMGNIYFMWYLLENYSTNSAVKNLVDNNELFFVPIVNPDGLKWNEKIAPGGGGMQRKNLRPNGGDSGTVSSSNNKRGVDVNRNFNYL